MVRMAVFFWGLTTCRLVRFHCFGETYCLHLQDLKGLISFSLTQVPCHPAWRFSVGSDHFPSFLDSDWPIPQTFLHFPASPLQSWRWRRRVSPKHIRLPAYRASKPLNNKTVTNYLVRACRDPEFHFRVYKGLHLDRILRTFNTVHVLFLLYTYFSMTSISIVAKLRDGWPGFPTPQHRDTAHPAAS
jgi:hypothetical protein